MISTPVNAEITEYHERFFFGMSLRQLVCAGFAASLAVGTGAAGYFWFNLNINTLGYLIMLEVSPLVALGWIRIKGYPFEQFFLIWLRWNFLTQRLPIKNIRKEDAPHHVSSKKSKSLRECSLGTDPKIGAKAACKTAASAKKELCCSERQRRKADRAAARAEKRSRVSGL